MSDITTSAGRDAAVFDPRKAATRDAKLDAVIAYARRVKDWQALEVAVDQKVQQIREFVGWWGDAVSVNHGAGRGNKKIPERLSFSAEQAEEITGISPMQVSRWRSKLKDAESYKETLYGAAYRKLMSEAGQTVLRGSANDGENEWYTPQEYIDRAKAVMGDIDLDPASSEQANESVGAAQIFTKDDDGLTHEWRGRVWMNPPYAQPAIQQFMERIVDEYQAGRVTEAIVLTHNNTDTKWFQLAAIASAAICFTSGRISFVNTADKSKCSPAQGQAFFYFGDNTDVFCDRFGDVGIVMMLRKPPPFPLASNEVAG